MGFIDKITTFATGKTAEERSMQKAAMAIIRRKVNSEALQERQTQSIRVAREREKFKAERQIKKLRQPMMQNYWTGMSYGSPGGQQRFVAPTRTVITKRKKGKKIVRVYRGRQPNYKFVDVLGLGR